MVETSRHDTWQAADRYEAYMGRWSRQIARRFLDWLDAGSGLDWLDIGCGTGALSAAILAQCNPKSLISIDSSEGFVATARATIQDRRAEFHVGDAQAISLETASRDAGRVRADAELRARQAESADGDEAGGPGGCHRRVLCLGLSRPGRGVHACFLGRGGGPRLRCTGARRGQALFLLHAGWSGRIDEQSRLAAG